MLVSNSVLHFILPADIAHFLVNDTAIGVFIELPSLCLSYLTIMDVSVSSSCSNKNMIDWVVKNDRNLFLTVLETESPRSVYGHGRVLVKVLFLQFAECQIFLISSHGGQQREKENALRNFINP